MLSTKSLAFWYRLYWFWEPLLLESTLNVCSSSLVVVYILRSSGICLSFDIILNSFMFMFSSLLSCIAYFLTFFSACVRVLLYEADSRITFCLCSWLLCFYLTFSTSSMINWCRFRSLGFPIKVLSYVSDSGVLSSFSDIEISVSVNKELKLLTELSFFLVCTELDVSFSGLRLVFFYWSLLLVNYKLFILFLFFCCYF